MSDVNVVCKHVPAMLSSSMSQKRSQTMACKLPSQAPTGLPFLPCADEVNQLCLVTARSAITLQILKESLNSFEVPTSHCRLASQRAKNLCTNDGNSHPRWPIRRKKAHVRGQRSNFKACEFWLATVLGSWRTQQSTVQYSLHQSTAGKHTASTMAQFSPT